MSAICVIVDPRVGTNLLQSAWCPPTLENALERGPSQCQGRRTDRSWCALQEALGAGAESTTYIDGSEALKTEGVPSSSLSDVLLSNHCLAPTFVVLQDRWGGMSLNFEHQQSHLGGTLRPPEQICRRLLHSEASLLRGERTHATLPL